MDTIPERRMEMQPKRPTAAGRYEPWPHRGVWEEDCPGKLLLSSADRGWSDLSAELCTVRRGVVPWRTPQSDIRICIAVRSNETIVTRQAPGIESQIVAGRRTVWLSPPGLQEGSVDFAQDMPEFLHIYLPLSHFSSGNFDTDTDESAICALSYKTAFEDPLLAEIGHAVVSELKTEPPPAVCSTEPLHPVWRRGCFKSMSARHALSFFLVAHTRGSISADSFVC
jgi:AraC family transcriptional regulator